MRNRRKSEPPTLPSPAPEPTSQPLRLRHALLLGFCAWMLWGIVPRARAAWTLRDAATALADHARCLAGPTAPALLREDPAQLETLVRRRLLAAQPEEAVFAACAKLAHEVDASPLSARAHGALARQFAEYSELPSGAGDDLEAFALASLLPGTRKLAELADAAWPFERKGFKRLIEPSSIAREAPYPAELPTPVLGRGYPAKRSAYRNTWYEGGRWYSALGQGSGLAILTSVDQGVTWTPTSLNVPGLERHAGKCSALGSSHGFTIGRTRVEGTIDSWVVHSWDHDQIVGTTSLGVPLAGFRTSCDPKLLVVVAGTPTGEARVLACEHGGGCAPLAYDPAWLTTDFDVAQIEGATVFLTSGRGITRVRSSWDRGRSWTPAVVAYDGGAAGAGSGELSAPNQLMVMGRRVMIFGAGQRGYPVLYSDDFGATLRGAEPQVTNPSEVARAEARR